MASTEPSYIRSASTMCTCEACIIPGPPARRGEHAPQERSSYVSPARDPRKLLWISIRYLGGPEGQWEVTARGQKWRVCAHQDAFELLRTLNGPFRAYR